MDTKVILNALGQAGSFFKIINKNDWAEDAMLAGGVVTAIVDLLNATGGHITLETLRSAALWTAVGLVAKAVMGLLTSLHILKSDPVAVTPVEVPKTPII